MGITKVEFTHLYTTDFEHRMMTCFPDRKQERIAQRPRQVRKAFMRKESVKLLFGGFHKILFNEKRHKIVINLAAVSMRNTDFRGKETKAAAGRIDMKEFVNNGCKACNDTRIWIGVPEILKVNTHDIPFFWMIMNRAIWVDPTYGGKQAALTTKIGKDLLAFDADENIAGIDISENIQG